MALPAELAATAAAREAAAAFLIRFSFVSTTKRVWTGFGKLRTADAAEWDGLGEVARLEGLGESIGTSARAGKIVASGVSSDVLTRATGEVAEFMDRPVAIYLQAFAERALYGAPVPIAFGLMRSMEVTRDAETRTIAINYEGPYTGRRRPAAGWYSHSDQQKRFTGDLFCERVPYLLFHQERWPDYPPE